MTFKKDGKIVKSYVILILAGKKTIDDVPDTGNLRDVVEECLKE